MNEPSKYEKYNQLQRQDAYETLKEFSSRILWKNGTPSTVMDIGCGDGSVTNDILKQFIPKPYEKVIGCDIQDTVVKFANENYRDERTAFEVVDIKGKIQKKHKRCCDHLFSFYTLHWVQEQKKAISNIYKMLKPGGDCLLMFLANMPIFDVYKILSYNPKWSKYMYDVDKYISPYQYSDRPEKQFIKLMKKCGFTKIHVECREKMYTYHDFTVLKKSLSTINPFHDRLSPIQREQFLEDYFEAVRNMNLIDHIDSNENEHLTIRCPYTLLIAYGYKK